LTGAEIWQFASANDLNVMDRQIRRYREAAYRLVAKIARRDRVQLLGRHLIQRRALYARAIKEYDLRSADDPQGRGGLRGVVSVRHRTLGPGSARPAGVAGSSINSTSADRSPLGSRS
jgi:hypothetical protein